MDSTFAPAFRELGSLLSRAGRQEEAKKKTAEAAAGGGMVTVVASGAGELVSIKIEKDVVNPEDVDMLQDLILAAFNDAAAKVDEHLAQKLGALGAGLKIPGM